MFTIEKNYYLLFDVYVCFTCMCVYGTTCVHDAWIIQKKALGPLGLALQMIVNYHVDDGYWTHVLWKSS